MNRDRTTVPQTDDDIQLISVQLGGSRTPRLDYDAIYYKGQLFILDIHVGRVINLLAPTSVRGSIRRHASELAKYGEIHTFKVPTGKSGNLRSFIYLNEEQAVELVMRMLPSRDKVRDVACVREAFRRINAACPVMESDSTETITPSKQISTIQTPSTPGQTMSSLEIADLTGKEHHNVMRDIRVMFQGLGMPAIKFEGCYRGANGKDLPCYHLPQEETITLVSGYDVVMRHKIVCRWRELEQASAQPALPNFSNPVEAARAWADAQEKAQIAIAKVEELKPQADALVRISEMPGSMCVRDAAKALKVPLKDLSSILQTEKWAYRSATEQNRLVGYQDKINAGYLEHRIYEYPGKGGEVKIASQMVITAKGLTKLPKLIERSMGQLF